MIIARGFYLIRNLVVLAVFGFLLYMIALAIVKVVEPQPPEITIKSIAMEGESFIVQGHVLNATSVSVAGYTFYPASQDQLFPFRLKIDLSVITENPITIVAKRRWMLIFLKESRASSEIPLPSTRWERYHANGKLVSISINTPTMPFWGWWSDTWVYFSNGKQVAAMQTPFWFYPGWLLLISIVSYITWVRVSTHLKYVRNENLREAENRLKEIHRGWVTVSRKDMKLIPEHERYLDESKVFSFIDDIRTFAKSLQLNQTQRNLLLYADALEEGFPHYKIAKQVLHSSKYSTAIAWDAVQHLSMHVPYFAYMFKLVEQAWMPAANNLLADPVPSEFLLDALGILMPTQTFVQNLATQDQLHGGYTALPKVWKEQVDHLYTLYEERVRLALQPTDRNWDSAWFEMLSPHAMEIAAHGFEGFYAFLLSLKTRTNCPVMLVKEEV